MLKKDEKIIREAVVEERECGHLFCDFDDRDPDLQEIACFLDIDMVEDEDGYMVFKNDKDKQRVEEALEYYYDLH